MGPLILIEPGYNFNFVVHHFLINYVIKRILINETVISEFDDFIYFVSTMHLLKNKLKIHCNIG